MVVCKFFLQGNCRFGANCRNEHPAGQGGSSGGGGGFGNQNRFGALSNTGNNRFGVAADAAKPYTLNLSEVKLDLNQGQGRPNWVLSTYGAGRGTPASLFEGNEYSPEEMRLRHYEMASKGQEAQAEQEALQLWTKAEQDINNAASHIDDIPKFMEEAEQKRPNRYDFLKADGTKTREQLAQEAEASGNTSSGSGGGGFGGDGAGGGAFGGVGSGGGGFGQSSSNANPFARPAAATFGQPSQPSAFGGTGFGRQAQSSAFGQPAFGQSGFGASSPAFGQAGSGLGQSGGTSAFGQPAQTAAFGRPAFGASGFGKSAFGQLAQPTTTSAFGQPAQTSTQSPFGQASSTTPAFGSSGFGQTARASPFAAPSASSSFGAAAPAFGQPAQSTPAFGQASQPTSTFGQQSQQNPAFGQASQPGAAFGQSAFGQPAQPSAFGKTSFGQPAQPATSSPFGQTSSTSSGFGTGTSTFGQSAQQNASPFGQAAQTKNNEVSMDAEAPTSTLPQTQAPTNPFSMPQSAAPSTQPQSASLAIAPIPAPAPVQANNNPSQTLSSLTSKSRKPLHYTETLPFRPAQTNMNKQLISYRGQQVQYLSEGENRVPCYNRPDGKGPEKIWFPEDEATPEVAALNREDKLSDLEGDKESHTEDVKQQYVYLLDEGKFKNGKIPLVPPMRECISYDF